LEYWNNGVLGEPIMPILHHSIRMMILLRKILRMEKSWKSDSRGSSAIAGRIGCPGYRG
jgi:hypothetical protein